jgi:hypothetical protein
MSKSEIELVTFLAEQRGWDICQQGEKLILSRESMLNRRYECEIKVSELLADIERIALDYDSFEEAEKEIRIQKKMQVSHINITAFKNNTDAIKFHLKQLAIVLAEEIVSFRLENSEK